MYLLKTMLKQLSLIVLIWFFVCCLSGEKQILGCDVDSFVYKEFGQRCLKLADLVQQFKTAKIFNMPDKQKIKGKLLNEWVDFYLAHGKKPPGDIAYIASGSWAVCIKKAGKAIYELTRKKINFNDVRAAFVPFYLLGKPKKFEKISKLMNNWRILLNNELLPTDDIISITSWLQQNLIMVKLINKEFASFYDLQKIKNHVNELWQSWAYVLKAKGEAQKTAVKFELPILINDLKKSYNTWRYLTFSQPLVN